MPIPPEARPWPEPSSPTEPALPSGEPPASAVLAAVSEPVYAVDRDRRVIYWNAAAEQLTGYSAAEVVGRRCRDNLLDHVDAAGKSLCRTACPLRETIYDGQTRETQVFLHHRAGHRVPIAVRSAPLRSADGAITGAVEVFHDDSRLQAVSERLDEAQKDMLTDPLTEVANRRMLERALDVRHYEYERYDRGYAVLFCDVDHFKQVNDRMGHDAGDRALRAVATALQECTRPSDIAGRWGGDEFLVVAPVSDLSQALALAGRARQRVAAGPGTHDGHQVSITIAISIGVALARPGDQARDPVTRASMALRQAKMAGRDRAVAG